MDQDDLGVSSEVAAWVTRRLGSAPAVTLFEVAHLSVVTALRLEDGRELVVKTRRGLRRARACVAGQAALHADGFACPRPLTAVEEVGGLAVHAESYVPGGGHLVGTGPEVTDAFAVLLADLIARARRLGVPRPEPAPLWLAWDHPGPGSWPALEEPPPHPHAVDGAEWLTEVVTRLRRRLDSVNLDEVVGHGDWENQNMAWDSPGQIRVVHDWDSLTTRPEAALAGAAAATFATGDQPVLAPLDASERFLATYQQATGRSFTKEEVQVAWAAGLWLAVHNARMELLYDRQPVVLQAVAAQADERLRRAAA